MIKSILKKLLKYTVIAAIWIAIWHLISVEIGNELLFPTPLAVARRFIELCQTREFYKIIGESIKRVVQGMAIGMLIGVVGGTLSAVSRIVRDFFSPLLAVIKSTPVASFIILLVLWVKRDITPIIISSLMVVPIVWANIEMGLRKTDRSLLEMATAYKMPRIKQIRNIYIPSAYPYFLSSLRSSLGMAWKAGIAAEVLLQPLISIGKQIFEAKYMLETVDLFAWTVAVIILSVLIELLFVLIFGKAAKRYSGGDTNG